MFLLVTVEELIEILFWGNYYINKREKKGLRLQTTKMKGAARFENEG